MTEETKPKSQQLLEEQHALRGELEELIAEQRRLGDDLRRARSEDASERLEAVRGGGNIRSAVSSLVSRVRGVEDRGAALSELIWTTKLRIAQLDEEYHAQKYAELESELPGAQSEFREVDAQLPVLQKRREDTLDRVNYLNREMRDLERRQEEAQTELDALKRSGPEA